MAAGLLRAADSPDFLYRFRLPVRAARVEWTSASVGNWDVSVTVDTAKCQLTCAYRLRRNSPAARMLAPPVVSVLVYSNFVSLPQKLTVDPAGLEFPTAAAKFRPRFDYPYLPGRKLLAASPPAVLASLPAVSHDARLPFDLRPVGVVPRNVPRRI